MEQDEVYHHAMGAAGNKIKNWKSGADKDGHPLAKAARSQRHAIQSEQVQYGLVHNPRADCIVGHA